MAQHLLFCAAPHVVPDSILFSNLWTQAHIACCFFPLLIGTLLEHMSMLLRAMQELGN